MCRATSVRVSAHTVHPSTKTGVPTGTAGNAWRKPSATKQRRCSTRQLEGQRAPWDGGAAPTQLAKYAEFRPRCHLRFAIGKPAAVTFAPSLWTLSLLRCRASGLSLGEPALLGALRRRGVASSTPERGSCAKFRKALVARTSTKPGAFRLELWRGSQCPGSQVVRFLGGLVFSGGQRTVTNRGCACPGPCCTNPVLQPELTPPPPCLPPHHPRPHHPAAGVGHQWQIRTSRSAMPVAPHFAEIGAWRPNLAVQAALSTKCDATDIVRCAARSLNMSSMAPSNGRVVWSTGGGNA